MNFKKNRLILCVAGAMWLLMIGTGVWFLKNYESNPGIAAAAPERWPAGSRLQRADGRATLVMLAHPRCPCTRASIGELSRLMTQAKGRVEAFVLFVKPSSVTDSWEQTDLLTSAEAIPGVTVVRDDAGHEAERFHAVTSGQTVLYDAQGRLLFSGGITSARGHAGDNTGRTAVVSLLTAGETGQRETPVFGCPLFAQTECPAGKGDRRETDNY
jgi:hypothetical protein